MGTRSTSLPLKLLLAFIAFRVINSLLIETFHVPDEYWQSIEVAHRFVFGYGFLTWEWQPHATLRSFLHPSLFAGIYKLLEWTSLDAVWASSIVVAPVLLQALFAAVGDACLYLFVSRNYGKSNAIWYMMVNYTNWFLLHNLTRTLANSIETTLFSIFLCFWPVYSTHHQFQDSKEAHRKMRMRRRVALACAGVCFLLRPTSAITWAFFALVHFLQTPHRLEFLIEASGISITILALGAALDVAYYEHLVSPLVSFVRFNFFTSGAAHYGSHPWHWYMSSGIPMLLGPYTLPFLVALTKRSSYQNPLLWLVGANIFFFSLIGHKEARFLMPLIPAMNVILTATIAHWWRSSSKSFPTHSTRPTQISHGISTGEQSDTSEESTQLPLLSGRSAKSKRPVSTLDRLKRLLIAALLVSSLGMAFYTCHIHQRGTLDLMNYVRNQQDINELLLLMPCHHTPGLAFIHRRAFHLDYLDCSPGLPNGQLDEADVFFENPSLFLLERYSLTSFDAGSMIGSLNGSAPVSLTTFVTNPYYEKNSGQKFTTISTPSVNRPLPTHVAMYNVLFEKAEVRVWLEKNGYKELESFPHAQFADGRVGTHVLLFHR